MFADIDWLILCDTCPRRYFRKCVGIMYHLSGPSFFLFSRGTYITSFKKVSISKCNWLDQNTVLAAGEDGIICFWNVDETDPSKQLAKTLSVEGGGVRDMELVALLPSVGFPNGRTILTVAAGQNVTFFDMSTLEVVHSYKMPIHFREEGG
jgi:hypothetical protein